MSKQPKTYDKLISTLTGGRIRNQDGEIGLEIEVEGQRLPGFVSNHDTGICENPLGRPWRIDQDGSLRRLAPGDMSAEYVLSGAVDRKELEDALNMFKECWIKGGSSSYDSYRTSVHVHLNMQHWPMRKVYSFLTAYVILEDLLIEWADGGTGYRKGNRFCLSTKDAEYIIDRLVDEAKRDWNQGFQQRDLKYGAVNIASLFKYGSLEFRALRGTVDVEVIKTWVTLLTKIKDYAEKFDYPQEIVSQFSSDGAKRFLERVFGTTHAALLAGTTDPHDAMYSSMRLAQDIAYAVQWEEPIKVEVPKSKESPFGIPKVRSGLTYGRAI